MKVALVVAAHPDDEILGCGGTVARLASEGWRVDIHIMAEGATSRSKTRDVVKHKKQLVSLRQLAKTANGILGAHSVTFSKMPDNRMDSVDLLDVVKSIDKVVKHSQPSMVFTHHSGDVNIDHKIVHDAVIAACRPQPGHCVKELLFFEVASSTEWRPPASATPFLPDTYFNIENYLDKKLEALRVYATEMRPFPHARSIEALAALARWRGASVGCQAAEAFMLGRRIL